MLNMDADRHFCAQYNMECSTIEPALGFLLVINSLFEINTQNTHTRRHTENYNVLVFFNKIGTIKKKTGIIFITPISSYSIIKMSFQEEGKKCPPFCINTVFHFVRRSSSYFVILYLSTLRVAKNYYREEEIEEGKS